MKNAALAAIAILLALQTSGLAAAGAQSKAKKLDIRTLSTRADRVSGGDVLIAIAAPSATSAAAANAPYAIALNGRDVSAVFHRQGESLVGLVTDGPRIEKYKIRGPVLVIAAILGFAAMIRPVGMVIASYVTFMVAILGSREMRVLESIIAAAVMTAFCVFLFTYLLNLPFQLWPRF